MKAALLTLQLTIISVVGLGQQESFTKIFIIRHADKQGDDLSPLGVKRANELQRVLSDANIAAIFSTKTIRTRKTVTPLAEFRHLSILDYDSAVDVSQNIMKKYVGKNILIVGHSNTVSKLIRAFGCTPPSSIDPDIPAGEFDNLFLLILKNDTGQIFSTCELLSLKYGKVSNRSAVIIK